MAQLQQSRIQQQALPRGEAAVAKLGWFQTLFSILASVAGVQSWSHFERDVTRGSPIRYVIVLGALMVAFVLLHVMIVDLVLRHAGM